MIRTLHSVVGRRMMMSRPTSTSNITAATSSKTTIIGSGVSSLPSSNCSFFSTQGQGGKNKKKKTALVVGSSGALGSCISRYLSVDLGMSVIGADVVHLSNIESDWDLDGFIEIPQVCDEQHATISDMTLELVKGVHYFVGESGDIRDGTDSSTPPLLDTIIVASGGWQPDPKSPHEVDDHGSHVEHEVLIEQGAKDYGAAVDRMMSMNLYPVIASGYTAQHFMNKHGLFVVIGATAALSATPGMIGYGLSKSSVHHYVQTLGTMTGKAILHKSQRKQSRKVRISQHNENMDTMTCVGILPTMIDTATNRAADPNGDFSSWTKPNEIAKEIGMWIQTPQLRPHSGSLVRVFSTKHTGTTFDLVR